MISFQSHSLIFLIIFYFVLPATSEPIVRMIQHEHYPAERHFVQTKDGYILGLYRIPKKNVQQNNRKVMLLMHGLTAAAPAYLTFGKDKSAGYIFSDAGYDVWIGNARGNTFSRKHATLNPDKAEFWNFSWHEMGVYDLPAMIDYILMKTNQTKLAYVGHSQGATIAFVMLSELPQYNKKISIFHAMTPPVIFKYNHPLYHTSMENVNGLGKWLYQNGYCELAPHKHLAMMKATAELCMSPTGSELCKYVVFNVFGPSNQYYNGLLLDIINHIPAGAGYKQFIHYGQISLAGKFQNFDHGTEKNIKLYGKPHPPEYNLSNIRTKVHILYGTNDWLIPQANIPLLATKLKPNVVAISKLKGFNHIDFTYAKNVQLVHQKILKVLKKHH